MTKICIQFKVCYVVFDFIKVADIGKIRSMTVPKLHRFNNGRCQTVAVADSNLFQSC